MFKKIFFSSLCLCGMFQLLASPPIENKNNSSLINGAVYYDLGVFNSSFWDYIKWDDDKNYSVVDPVLMANFFKSMSEELKSCNINQIYLSFAQLSSLDSYYQNDFVSLPISLADPIATQMKVFKQAQEQGSMDPNFNYLKCLADGFHQNGIKVNLSFGGQSAEASDFNIPSQAAPKLLAFLSTYDIDGIDFDIELNLEQTVVDSLKAFFSEVHQGLENKQMTITVMMGISDWPKGCLKSLFNDFNNLFDGVNLMAYSNTDYYLDATNPDWGMTSWIDIVGKENASKITIGFFDAVPYEKTESRDERGGKAAGAYLKLISDLEALNYPVNFRAPFWWPAEDEQYHHYQHTSDGSVQFISQDQLNFYQKM